MILHGIIVLYSCHLHCNGLRCIAWYCIVLNLCHCIVRVGFAWCCIALQCIALPCIALDDIVLHYIVLHLVDKFSLLSFCQYHLPASYVRFLSLSLSLSLSLFFFIFYVGERTRNCPLLVLNLATSWWLDCIRWKRARVCSSARYDCRTNQAHARIHRATGEEKDQKKKKESDRRIHTACKTHTHT